MHSKYLKEPECVMVKGNVAVLYLEMLLKIEKNNRGTVKECT